VAAAHTHRPDPLALINRLEPQHLAVELYGTRQVRDVQTGLDYALNGRQFHRNSNPRFPVQRHYAPPLQ
jgi:hypothetical protein